LIELGADVNAQNNMTGATPLHMVASSRKACVEDRVKVIDLLVTQGGAHLDKADNYGSLPVHAAVTDGAGAADETRILLEKLQPQAPALHVMIQERDVVNMEQLLDQDSSQVNAPFHGQTPLGYVVDELIAAVMSDRKSEEQDSPDTLLDVLGILLKYNADTNVTPSSSSQASAAALMTGDAEIREAPLHEVVVAVRDCMRQSKRCAPLEKAVDLLVNPGGALIPPSTADLLHQAARRNEVPFARFLIERLRLDPNVTTRQAMTPLHFAARSGQLEMLVRGSFAALAVSLPF
jgi:ankyrin repeat protein